MAEKKTSAWLYVGCGCLALIALAVVVAGGGCFAFLRWARGLEKTFESPEARDARAIEILGARDGLPEGYHAAVPFAMPFGMIETVILSDEIPERQHVDIPSGSRSFIYVSSRFMKGHDDPRVRAFFDGREDDPRVLEHMHVNLDLEIDQIASRGSVELEGGVARYVLARGDAGFGAGEGPIAIVSIECRGDSRDRIGIWRTPPDDDPARSPATEEGLMWFIGHFRFCRDQSSE